MTSGQKTGFTTLKAAAEYLHISVHLVREALNDGKLPYKTIGSRRRIPWSSVYDFARPLAEKFAPINLEDSSKSQIEKSLERIEAEIASIRAILCREVKGRWK